MQIQVQQHQLEVRRRRPGQHQGLLDAAHVGDLDLRIEPGQQQCDAGPKQDMVIDDQDAHCRSSYQGRVHTRGLSTSPKIPSTA